MLSEGLELQPTSIKVYKDSVSATNLLTKADTYAADVAYKLTTDTSGNEDTFTVDFFSKYILGLSAAQDIVVEYKATVTTDAPKSVNLETNTVTLNYSTTPSDSTGNGTLKDETKHYTFDIDANILGDDSWKTTEVVKVGVDANGKEITKSELPFPGCTYYPWEGIIEHTHLHSCECGEFTSLSEDMNLSCARRITRRKPPDSRG